MENGLNEFKKNQRKEWNVHPLQVLENDTRHKAQNIWTAWHFEQKNK